MPSKNGQKRLIREGEPSQETDQGLEIPVPDKSDRELLDRGRLGA